MRRSVFCKTLAVILSVLLLCSTVFFVAMTVFVGAAGGYTGGYFQLKDEVMEGILREYAYEVADAFARGDDLEELYGENNFYYQIIHGNFTNYDGQPYERTVSIYRELPISLVSAKVAVTDAVETTVVQDDYVYYEILPAVTKEAETEEEPITRIPYAFTLYEKTDKEGIDLLSLAEFAFDFSYDMRYAAPIIAIASFLLWICMLIFLFCAAGHRKGTDTPMLNRIDRIPFDLYTAICASIVVAISVIGILLLEMLLYNYYHSIAKTLLVFTAGGAGIFVCAVLEYLILLGYLLSFATRVKVGGLLRRTLIARVVIFLWKIACGICKGIWALLRSIPLVWKTSLILFGISLAEFICIVVILREGDTLILWFLEKLVLCPIILYAAMMLRKLKKGGEAIAAGKLAEKINTKYMPADFGDFGQTLNHIGDGLSHAVDEQLKSERMKTELITNVSHDIKTPLTSIVNYVDLIKKEEPESETMREYIDVLDRQSARLKKLIEDLVEASKASTGAISMEMARCEVGVLLEQTLGEYEEKLIERSLTPVVSQPEEPICIMADGRRLWRVFDNLLNNICKYAMPETRVYISLEKVGKRAVITFRNISRDPLNISSDELMERFVRGDASRNTEGSGLGLSIARSLTDLQGGNLSLAIDGDLFKATVIFDIVE